MSGLKYAEILKANRELGSKLKGSVFQIAVLSNIVVNQLGDILEYELRQQGINAKLVFGDYNNIVQDSARFKNSNAVILFWETASLVEGLQSKAETIDAPQLSSLVERTQNEIELVLKNLQNVPLVLFNSFSSLLFSFDELKDGKFSQLAKKLNNILNDRAVPNQLTVDIDKIIAKTGISAAVDFRLFQSSKALYAIEFLKEYAATVQPAFCAITGRGKKVLVLDCDNTLWGGVLGEDGENGIQMGENSKNGKIFQEAQHILRGFQKRGILLALCSKNNAEDVNQVFLKHPDRVLLNEDLVAKRVNWQDKVTNLRELASELNLGLESFVFVDDSDFEIGLIEKELPQVKCIKVPTVLSSYPEVLRSVGRDFFSFTQTKEDASKTKMYQEEQVRKSDAAKFSSTEDYLKSLGLKINIQWNKAIPIPRVAQLTQKTNQFNLTTRRYTEGEIQGMIDNHSCALASFSVADKYGDYGITGLIIAKLRDQEASIDTFLMSCRVIGRNIEQVFFDHFMKKLISRGVKTVNGEYLPTPKNTQVADFYSSRGFVAKKNLYQISTKDYKFSGIDYIEVLESESNDD